jgi:hypothetical protein
MHNPSLQSLTPQVITSNFSPHRKTEQGRGSAIEKVSLMNLCGKSLFLFFDAIALITPDSSAYRRLML